MLFFTCIKLVACVLVCVCVCNQSHASNGEDCLSLKMRKNRSSKADNKKPIYIQQINKCFWCYQLYISLQKELIGVYNSRLKAIQMIGQRKAFYIERILESSYVWKETVDIDILGHRKMQSIRITSRPPSTIRRWNQLSQFT